MPSNSKYFGVPYAVQGNTNRFHMVVADLPVKNVSPNTQDLFRLLAASRHEESDFIFHEIDAIFSHPVNV